MSPLDAPTAAPPIETEYSSSRHIATSIAGARLQPGRVGLLLAGGDLKLRRLPSL